MLAKLIDFSLENRFLVFVAFALMAAAGSLVCIAVADRCRA